MFRKILSLLCFISAFVIFQSCASKSLQKRFDEHASKFECGYYPTQPYVSYAFLFCNLKVKDLERILDLVELRLNAKTLEKQIALQFGVNALLRNLILSIDLEAGTEKHGEPFFPEVKKKAVTALFSFSMINTHESLAAARDVVFDTEVQIHRELGLIDW